MNNDAAHGSEPIKLLRIVAGQAVEEVVLSSADFTARARCRPATATEIRSLIEELFRQLPEPERQKLYIRIRSDGMI